MADNYVLESKIDRLETHFKEFRKDAVIDRGLNKDVRTALIGSSLNGNKGVVNLLDEIDKRVQEMEKKQILNDEMRLNYKVTIGTLFTALIGFFVWFFESKK